MRYLLVATLTLSGCAAHVKPRAKLVIPRDCITDVHLADDTKCVYDEKLNVYHCSPLVIDHVKGCERVEVVK